MQIKWKKKSTIKSFQNKINKTNQNKQNDYKLLRQSWIATFRHSLPQATVCWQISLLTDGLNQNYLYIKLLRSSHGQIRDNFIWNLLESVRTGPFFNMQHAKETPASPASAVYWGHGRVDQSLFLFLGLDRSSNHSTCALLKPLKTLVLKLQRHCSQTTNTSLGLSLYLAVYAPLHSHASRSVVLFEPCAKST